MVDDPKDSPTIRRVLYTNDVKRLLATFVSGLLTLAEPDRIKKALEETLANWDHHVKLFEATFAAGTAVLERRKQSAKGKN